MILKDAILVFRDIKSYKSTTKDSSSHWSIHSSLQLTFFFFFTIQAIPDGHN